MGYLRDLRKKVFGLFDELVNESQGIEVDHRAEVRASSLPICWRDIALTEWARRAGRMPTKKWHLGSELYTSIGTSAHESIQKFLGISGVLWGSWECHKCGKMYLNQKMPGTCCGEIPEYIEYSLVHPNPAIGEFGHCDGLVILPFGLGYVVLEIKTTGESLASSRRVKGPADEHHMQGSVYHDMFKKGFARVRKRGPKTPENRRGEVIFDADAEMPPGKLRKAILFIYVRRDRPKPKFWIPLLVKPLKGTLKDIERDAPRTRKAIEKGKVPPGRCRKFLDARNPYNWKDICPWAKPVCFAPDPKGEAEHLFELSKNPRKKPHKEKMKEVTLGGRVIQRK